MVDCITSNAGRQNNRGADALLLPVCFTHRAQAAHGQFNDLELCVRRTE